MNAGNPVQIDLFGVSVTRTKDTRLAAAGHEGWDFPAGTSRNGGGRRLLCACPGGQLHALHR
jgi:hypothetical protein